MKAVAAFAATVVIAVPGWRTARADLATDGPHEQPAGGGFAIREGMDDEVDVSASVDRGVFAAGGRLDVTISARTLPGEKARKVSLDVRVLRDMGYGNERVPNPPKLVAKQRIVVDAPNAWKPEKKLSFALGDRTAAPGMIEWFDIEVVPAGVKATESMFSASDQGEGSPLAAKLSVAAWTGNSFPLAIELPAAVSRTPFAVNVRVTNPGAKPLAIDSISLDAGTPERTLDRYINDPYDPRLPGEKLLSIESKAPAKLTIAPGATAVVAFTVTVLAPPRGEDPLDRVTLVAHATAASGGAIDIASQEIK